MRTVRKFTADNSVADLVKADYDILPVLSRFSLPLGFGTKTIGTLCRETGIDVDAFLLTINFLLDGEIDAAKMEKVDPRGVANFLHNSHDYYLEYKFPHIRANMLSSLDPVHADVNPIIVKYFDDYVAGVKAHFEYEEHVLFPYVEALAGGTHRGRYTTNSFVRQHDHEVEGKLAELKNIILRYYTTSVPYRMYDVLVDIFNCEADLRQHSDIEDRILVPLLKKLEAKEKH